MWRPCAQTTGRRFLTDTTAILSLYPRAFPDEDLVPLVRELLKVPDIAMSLTAMNDSNLAGHAVFTVCSVEGSDDKVALLGPVAVDPDFQRQGIGSNLIGGGLERMRAAGISVVCVLGDPAYYGRLGFEPEARIAPPYPLPAGWTSAWQSQYLGKNPIPLAGTLVVPRQWRDPALWSSDGDVQ